jgi:hypothetical protein
MKTANGTMKYGTQPRDDGRMTDGCLKTAHDTIRYGTQRGNDGRVYEDPGKVWNSVEQRCSSVTGATGMTHDFLFLQELQDELIMYTHHQFNSWPCPSETPGCTGRLWDQSYPGL